MKLPQLRMKSGFSLVCWDGGGGGGGVLCCHWVYEIKQMLFSWSSEVNMVALMKQPNIPNPNTTYIITLRYNGQPLLYITLKWK